MNTPPMMEMIWRLKHRPTGEDYVEITLNTDPPRAVEFTRAQAGPLLLLIQSAVVQWVQQVRAGGPS